MIQLKLSNRALQQAAFRTVYDAKRSEWEWFVPAQVWLAQGNWFSRGTPSLNMAKGCSEGATYLERMCEVGRVEVSGHQRGPQPTRPEGNYSATMYVKVNPRKWKDFARLVGRGRPNDFEEVSPNTFRLGWN